MRLQDREELAPLAHGGLFARALLHVAQDGHGLDPGRHQRDGGLEHEHEVLDLLLAALGVLPRRVEVQAGAAMDVVPELDLLAGLVLAADVLGREFIEAVFAAPDQGCLQAGDGLREVPFRGAQVAEEAFAGEPEAFGVAEGGGGEGAFGGGGQDGP